jgi:hypothetical protein
VIGLGAGEIAPLHTNLNKIGRFTKSDPLMVNIAETNFKHAAQMPSLAAIVVGRWASCGNPRRYIDSGCVLVKTRFPLHLLTLDALEQVFCHIYQNEGQPLSSPINTLI